MNLVIDIGNTAAKTAVFDNDTLVETHSQSDDRLSNRIVELCRRYPIDKVVAIAATNPPPDVKETLATLKFPVLWPDRQTPLPITNLYRTPETQGYDRIAAVTGAHAQYPDNNLLVIDAGTALTFEFIDARGRYHGGNISPGLQMRLKALHHYTGRLPLVTAAGETPPIGTDTQTAIRSGVIKGIEYEIKGYITDLTHKYPDLLVFLTGGDDISLETSLKNTTFADKFLVLKGLNRILNYNNDKQ